MVVELVTAGRPIHELSIDELREFPIDKLPMPAPNIIVVDREHLRYWAWTAEVQQGPKMRKGPMSDLAIDHALIALFRIATLPLTLKPLKPGEKARERPPPTKAESLLSYIMSEGLIEGGLAFPILESIIRHYCSACLDSEGKALADWSLKDGFEIKKGRLMTLEPLLRFFIEKVLPDRKDQLQTRLQEIGLLMEAQWAKGNFAGYDWMRMLATWRNDLLHGRGTWLPQANVCVVDIVCTFLWHEFPDAEYDKFQPAILDWAKKRSHDPTPWSYYWIEEE